MDLQKEWFELSEQYCKNNTIISDNFIKIYTSYSKANRYYHNINHINELLTLIDEFKEKIDNINAVKFSVWFHDVIYNAWRKDNEEKSAKLAHNYLLKMDVDKKTIDFVVELILLTKGHRIYTSDFDTNIFLDSDLAILGSENEKYNIYCENIRKEYFFVPENLYKKGRISVLEKFLTMGNIYKTDEMKLKYEEKARLNLNMEIKKLKG